MAVRIALGTSTCTMVVASPTARTVVWSAQGCPLYNEIHGCAVAYPLNQIILFFVMNRNTHRNLTSPIIGRCVLLIDHVIKFTSQTPKSIKYPYVDTLKASTGLLFKYAMY